MEFRPRGWLSSPLKASLQSRIPAGSEARAKRAQRLWLEALEGGDAGGFCLLLDLCLSRFKDLGQGFEIWQLIVSFEGLQARG